MCMDTSDSLCAQVFVVGPRFKGLKMLPPGVHFLSYQAAGRDGRVSPAVSTFLALKPRDVVVRRWDAAQEGLVALADEDEVCRGKGGDRCQGLAVLMWSNGQGASKDRGVRNAGCEALMLTGRILTLPGYCSTQHWRLLCTPAGFKIC
jgi:hypothetical protein